MWIDLEDKEIKPMFTYVNNNEGKPTGQQTIVIPTFDLYSKKVDDGTGNKRNHYICIRNYYFTYLLYNSKNNLLCKISSKSTNDINFISCGSNTLAKEETMREIVIQQNVFT